MKYFSYLKTFCGLIILLIFSRSVFAQLVNIGLNDKAITSIAISSPLSGQHILVVGTKGNGVYYNDLSVAIDSLNDAWGNAGLNNKNIHSVFILNSNIGPAGFNTLYAAVENDSLNTGGYLAWQKQLNGAEEWTAIDSTLRDSVNHIWGVAGFGCETCVSPAAYMDLYCCTEKGIYSQQDSGWQKILTQGGLEWISVDHRTHSIWVGGSSIAMTPLLFTSDNYGDDWMECKFYGLGDAVCYGVAIDPNHPDTVYAAVEYFILKSEDGGLSWKKAGFLGDVCRSFIAVEVDPNNSEHVVVISYNEFFESYNGGQSWYEPLALNFKSKIVDMVSTTFNDSLWVIYMATENDGIFAYHSSPVIGMRDKSKNLPAVLRLEQNYPNPFNPVTRISWQLAVGSTVELAVYNLLGQKVATLFKGQQNPGSYSYKWNAGAFPSGVYLYRLVTEDGIVQTKKMILLK